jgi:hypothetical protein
VRPACSNEEDYVRNRQYLRGSHPPGPPGPAANRRTVTWVRVKGLATGRPGDRTAWRPDGLATALTHVASASRPLCLIWRTDLTSPARPPRQRLLQPRRCDSDVARRRRLITRQSAGGGPAWKARRMRHSLLPVPLPAAARSGRVDHAFPRPFHDHEGFYIKIRSKVFAIMKSLVLASGPDVTSVSAGPSSRIPAATQGQSHYRGQFSPVFRGFLSAITDAVKTVTRGASTHDRNHAGYFPACSKP